MTSSKAMLEPEISRQDVDHYYDAAGDVIAIWKRGRTERRIPVEGRGELPLPIEVQTIPGEFANIHQNPGGVNAVINRTFFPKIRIGLPTDGAPSLEADAFIEQQRAYIAGVAVHELVHHRQLENWPEEHARAVAQQQTWQQNWAARVAAPVEYLNGYYDQPIEIAAHAAQAAAEMVLSGVAFEQTGLWQHICVRLCGQAMSLSLRARYEAAAQRYVGALTT